jgi:hypothetical protein
VTADPPQGFPLEPAPGQQDRTPAPQPVPRRSLLARPVVAGLIGVLVGAFLVGVPWLVLSLFGGGSPRGRSLAAPPQLGGLSRAQEAITKLDKTKGQSMIARIEKTDRETAARVTAAYGGAGTVVQCLVHHDQEPAGSTPDPDRPFVTNCQRTGPGLTVTLRSLSSEGNRDPRELAGIVEQAWRELA